MILKSHGLPGSYVSVEAAELNIDTASRREG